MQEQTIDIEWEGKPAKVVIKRLSWRQKVKLENMMSKVSLKGNNPDVSFDTEVYKVNLMLLCIKEAPFPVTDEGLDNLDVNEGDKIFDAIEAMNTISDKKKET